MPFPNESCNSNIILQFNCLHLYYIITRLTCFTSCLLFSSEHPMFEIDFFNILSQRYFYTICVKRELPQYISLFIKDCLQKRFRHNFISIVASKKLCVRLDGRHILSDLIWSKQKETLAAPWHAFTERSCSSSLRVTFLCPVSHETVIIKSWRFLWNKLERVKRWNISARCLWWVILL